MPKKRTKKNKLKGGDGKGSVKRKKGTSAKRKGSAKGKGSATPTRSGSGSRSATPTRSESGSGSATPTRSSGSTTLTQKNPLGNSVTWKPVCDLCKGSHLTYRCKKHKSIMEKITIIKHLKLKTIIYKTEFAYMNVSLIGSDETSQGEIYSSSIPNINIDFLFTTGLNGCLGVVFVLPDAISFVHIQSDLVRGLTGKDINLKIEEKLKLLLTEVSKKSNIIPKISSLSIFYNKGKIFLITVENSDILFKKVFDYLSKKNENSRNDNLFYSLSSNFGYNISKTTKLPEIFSFQTSKQPPPITNPNIESIDTFPLGL